MTDKGQVTANWGQLLIDEAKIIVNVSEYNPMQEKRILIPYISRQNSKNERNKIGLLNANGEIVVKPEFDIVLDDCYQENDIIRLGRIFPYGFVKSSGICDARAKFKYRAVTSYGSYITDMEFDNIVISIDKDVITVHNREEGYAVYDRFGNEIVPFGKYSWIDGFDHGLARVKIGKQSNALANNDNRWGIINTNGEVVLPIEYSDIWNFYDKNRFSTKIIKNGKESDVFFHNLNPDLPQPKPQNKMYYHEDDYGHHYGEFAGSYAQDVMGYSDDVINDAFEGAPDLYWNID